MMIVVTLTDGLKLAVNTEKIFTVRELYPNSCNNHARSKITTTDENYIIIRETPEEVATMCNQK